MTDRVLIYRYETAINDALAEGLIYAGDLRGAVDPFAPPLMDGAWADGLLTVLRRIEAEARSPDEDPVVWRACLGILRGRAR